MDRPIIPKKDLVPGAYYYGKCRNARVARWDGQKFWHWRDKRGSHFLVDFKHREDEDFFDVFDPYQIVDWGVNAIPLEEFDGIT